MRASAPHIVEVENLPSRHGEWTTGVWTRNAKEKLEKHRVSARHLWFFQRWCLLTEHDLPAAELDALGDVRATFLTEVATASVSMTASELPEWQRFTQSIPASLKARRPVVAITTTEPEPSGAIARKLTAKMLKTAYRCISKLRPASVFEDMMEDLADTWGEFIDPEVMPVTHRTKLTATHAAQTISYDLHQELVSDLKQLVMELRHKDVLAKPFVVEN